MPPILVLAGACSSLESFYSLEPEDGQGWAKMSDGTAQYRTNDFKVILSVPFSGSKRHSFGPCIFPVIPQVKENPRSLILDLMIETSEPARIETSKERWSAVLRSRNMDGLFGDEEFRRVQPYDVGGGQKDDRRYVGPVIFSEFDNSFIDLEIKGGFSLDGKSVELPVIRFDRESDIEYTPFTTEFGEFLFPTYH